MVSLGKHVYDDDALHFLRSERCPPTSNMLLVSQAELKNALVRQVADRKLGLRDAGRLCSTPQNVLLRRLEIGCKHTVKVVVKAGISVAFY